MTSEAKESTVGSDVPPNAPDEPTIRRHPSIDTLPLDQQTELYRREAIIKGLLGMRRNYGRIPRGERQVAAIELGVGWRMIHEYMERYVAYQAAYPEEPPVNVFIPLPAGRPQGSGGILTEDHKRVIRYAILERSRITIYATGRVAQVPDYDVEVRDIYRFVQAICPDVGSYDTVRRYVNHFRKEKPALCKLFIESRDAAERDIMLKRRNDVARPNQRWVSDVRHLPFYIIHEGERCPVSLLIIYDDYTRDIIAWKLIPAVKREKGGRLRRVKVTGRDVMELLAFAMLITGVRPDEFYTDNGPEYVALEPFLPRLADDPPIRFVHSRPRKPWGRGKVENGLGQVTKLLRRISAGYRPKKDRPSIDLARRTAKLTIEELEAEFEAHFQAANTYQPKTRPSRISLWHGVQSHPAPPIRKLAHLDVPSIQKNVTVDHWAIACLGVQWEPKMTNVPHRDTDIYTRWADAAASKEEQVLWAICLYGIWYAKVCLRDVWVVLQPKQPQSDTEHMRTQQHSLAELQQEGKRLIEEGRETIQRLVGDLPGRKTTTGEYLSVEATQQAKQQYAETEASHKRQKNAAARAQQSSVPEPPIGENENPPMISGLADVMRQFDEQLRRPEDAQ